MKGVACKCLVWAHKDSQGATLIQDNKECRMHSVAYFNILVTNFQESQHPSTM